MTLPQPYYHRGDVTIYHADCLEILPHLTGVDAVVTDPPYGMNNDCDYTRFTMGPNGHGQASSRCHKQIAGDDKPFDPSPWLPFPSVVLWGFTHFAARLPVGTNLVWIKRLDGGFGSFLSDAEIAWMKGGHGVYCRRDTSLLAETRNRLHPTQKPVGIMEWCIEKASDEFSTVLDPFLGSGTTAVACIRTGRKCIGIELEEKYCEISAKRCDRELDQGRLFSVKETATLKQKELL